MLLRGRDTGTNVTQANRARDPCNSTDPHSSCLFMQRCPKDSILTKARKGSVIFVPEQRAYYVYHLHKGVVGLYTSTASGGERMPVLVVPPHLVGIAALGGMQDPDKAEHVTEARAITPVIYCKTRREAVWALMDDPSVRAIVLNLIYRQMLLMGRLTAVPFKRDIVQRTLIVLRELASNIGTLTSDGGGLIEDLSHDEIATMVGTARPTITRVLRQLERDGLVATGWRTIELLTPANPWDITE